jgi:hypothetical protein
MDLSRERASRPFGAETSSSHNYPHLAREAGFELVFQAEKTLQGHRFLELLAARLDS